MAAGSRLALLEIETVLPVLLERRRIESVEQEPEAQRIQHVTLTPGRGARAIARGR